MSEFLLLASALLVIAGLQGLNYSQSLRREAEYEVIKKLLEELKR